MDGGEKFFTFNGSEYRGEYGLTASQEDYLEMICRNCPQSGSVRLGVLARKINVSESSASKMVHKLSETGLVTFEKYGTIYLTKRGRGIGEYLIFRHDVIESLNQHGEHHGQRHADDKFFYGHHTHFVFTCFHIIYLSQNVSFSITEQNRSV